jgi:hypothetical protein
MISLHFSGKQCITSSLTFEGERLEVWKSISFKEKEITATKALLETDEPISRQLKLNKERETLCPENFLIIGYTQASGFVPVPKHLEAFIQ